LFQVLYELLSSAEHKDILKDVGNQI